MASLLWEGGLVRDVGGKPRGAQTVRRPAAGPVRTLFDG
jgi:hypothetical protein